MKEKIKFKDILSSCFDEGEDGYINKMSELTGRIYMEHKGFEYSNKENKLYFDCGPEIETNSLSDSVHIYDYLDNLAIRLGIDLSTGESENNQSIHADNKKDAYEQYELLKQEIIKDGFEVRGDIY